MSNLSSNLYNTPMEGWPMHPLLHPMSSRDLMRSYRPHRNQSNFSVITELS